MKKKLSRGINKIWLILRAITAVMVMIQVKGQTSALLMYNGIAGNYLIRLYAASPLRDRKLAH